MIVSDWEWLSYRPTFMQMRQWEATQRDLSLDTLARNCSLNSIDDRISRLYALRYDSCSNGLMLAPQLSRQFIRPQK